MTGFGVRDSLHQCWIHPVHVPQTDPVWEGHDDGSIWMCGLSTDGVDPWVVFWVPPGAGVENWLWVPESQWVETELETVSHVAREG